MIIRSSSLKKVTRSRHRRAAITSVFRGFSSCLPETPRVRRTSHRIGIRSFGRRIFVTTVTLRSACKTCCMYISAAVFPSSGDDDDDGVHASVYRADDEPGEGGKDDLDACPQGAHYTGISILYTSVMRDRIAAAATVDLDTRVYAKTRNDHNNNGQWNDCRRLYS